MTGPSWSDSLREVYIGDCREVLAQLPEKSIHMCVTSPPYWGLRKYQGAQDLVWGGDPECEHEWGSELSTKQRGTKRGRNAQVGNQINEVCDTAIIQGNFCQKCGAWHGSHGMEPTPELYIQHEIEILRAVRRVLRDDGTVWWNIADSYSGGTRKSDKPQTIAKGDNQDIPIEYRPSRDLGNHPVIKPLDMCLIPQRLAIAAQEDGWFVRSMIVWSKNNPMPESVSGWRWEKHRVKVGSKRKASQGYAAEVGMRDNVGGLAASQGTIWQDCPGCPVCLPNDGLILRKGSWRPADSHEYIIMLAKTANYYADGEAVKEGQSLTSHSKGQSPRTTTQFADKSQGAHNNWHEYTPLTVLPNGRNLRSIWTFPTQPYKDSHYATFPEKLPELCIKAGTSEYGVCSKCGAPWARVTRRRRLTRPELPKDDSRYRPATYDGAYGGINGHADAGYTESTTLGWRATCNCQVSRVPATVLDPFAGTGTTLEVAAKLGRRSIGIDISDVYLSLIIDRNRQGALTLGGTS